MMFSIRRRFMPLAVLICFALFAADAQAQKIEAPKLMPVAPTAEQRQILREGVALHERGDYDAAIEKYQSVLKQNPDDALALYEIAYAQYAKKDYRASLETAYKASRYKWDELPRVYTLIGNIYDLTGEPKKAIDVYKNALNVYPEASLLYYNLAVTQSNLSDASEAKKNLKKSVSYDAKHPTSHLALAMLFRKEGYTTPALLAACRFLVVEPASRRSSSMLQFVNELMQGGVKQGDKPNSINLTLAMQPKKDEGDFGSLDMIIGLSKAVGMTEAGAGKTPTQLAIEQFDTLFAVMSEQDKGDKQSKFVWRYYVPYFAQLKKMNFVEPFYYHINRSRPDAEVQEWLAANKPRVDTFLQWSNQYAWARAD